MASSTEYLNFILGCVSKIPEAHFRHVGLPFCVKKPCFSLTKMAVFCLEMRPSYPKLHLRKLGNTPEQLTGMENITYKAMMGEYIIYYRGKIVGGIYDDRLLVKPVKLTVTLMPDAICELLYEGAKEMLLVDDVDNKDSLISLFRAMYGDLLAPKKKK